MSQTDSPEILLSGFADEAANQKTMDQQFAAFAALGLSYLTLRFIDAGCGIKNVMHLSSDEVVQIREKLTEYGLAVSSIGSPIGKVKLLDVDDGTHNTWTPFEQYLEEDVRKACELACLFESKLIRGFSFYHPRGEDFSDHVPQAVDQLGKIADVCNEFGLTFGLEVEANLIGQNGFVLAEMHRQIGSPALVLIFDGANLITQGYSTEEVFQQYLAMKPGLGWIHIKDFKNPEPNRRVSHVDEEALKHFCPVEDGDAGHRAILSDLVEELPIIEARMVARGAPGVFADLEPHLKGGGQFGGFSGPDGFGVALRSFCRICKETGVGYRLRGIAQIRSDQ